MKQKKESVILGTLFKKIAPQIGAKVLIEPEWGIVGQITFKSGQRSYFKYNSVDLNSLGSADIAHDKDYANFFMKSMGYQVVPGSKTFFSANWATALNSPQRNLKAAFLYAQHLGFPVIVKPNSGSQGSGVTLVHTKQEFLQAMRRIFKQDRVALVQHPVQGKDYRLVVLDQQLISAYQRIPLNIIGNGRSTIKQLLQTKQRLFVGAKRDTQINPTDPRILQKLKRQQLSMQRVLAKGQKVFLLDNANLSTGGDSIEVTNQVHPQFKRLAIQLTKDMGLRLCGVDVMVKGDISQPPGTYWVLEVNAAPGLDHYAKTGKAQKKIVEELYLKVLKSMER